MKKYLKYLLILLIPFLLAVSLRVTNDDGGNSISVVNTKSSSLTFDGVDDNVNCGDVDAINEATQLTLTGWAKQETLDVVAFFFKKIKDASNHFKLYTAASGFLWFDFKNEGSANYASIDYSTVISANNWFYWVIIFDGSQTGNANRLKFYVDNVLTTLGYSIYTIPSTIADLSGADFIISHNTSAWNGQFADVRIFNRVLSPEEITRIYRGEIITDGLVAHWPLQEGGLSEKAYDVACPGGVCNHGDLTNFTLSDGWEHVQNKNHYNQQMGHSTEILGGELITNGDMELDSDWSDIESPTTNERSNEQAHGGTYSRKYVVDSQYDGIENDPDFSIIQGNLYKVTASIYGDGINKAFLRLYDRDNTDNYWSPLSVNAAGYIYPATWTTEIWYFIALGTSLNVVFWSQCGTGVAAGTFYVDDVSVKQVTNSVPDGAKIPALADGSGTDAIGNAINNPGRGYNKSLLNVTN